jgi:hypothetical protein
MGGPADGATLSTISPLAGVGDVLAPQPAHRFPYPGLRPFEDDEFDLFVGRAEQVKEIIERLLKTNFASILGGSGCGKSSLVRAGVIPELRFRGETWLQVVLNAGQRPVSRLAGALSALLVPDPGDAGRTGSEQVKRLLTQQNGLAAVIDEYREDFRIRLRPGPLDARASAQDDGDRRRLSRGAKLLILLDQFEEIFAAETPEERAEAAQIVRLIVDSFEQRHPSVYLVLAMRSENLHSCAAYLDLPRVINQSSYLVRRLDDSEIGRAIVEPARYCRLCLLNDRRAGADRDSIGAGEFDPEVVRRLREEVRRLREDVDHLPLLQHALFRLWEAALAREKAEAEATGKPAPVVPEHVRLEDLECAAGGLTDPQPDDSLLRRCVKVHADRLYGGLEAREQRIAESLFRLLGTVDSNRLIKRRRTTVAEVLGAAPRGVTPAGVEQIIGRFRAPHPYLRVQGDDIDVAHEAFIRNWPRFRDWIRDEAGKRNCYDMLIDRLRKWRRRYRDPSASRLARGIRWGWDLLDRHARAEARAHGIERLETVRVARYLRELGEDAGAADPGDRPRLHGELLHFLRLSNLRAGAGWSLFALLVVTPLALYAHSLIEGQRRAEFDNEAKVFHSFAVAATSGSASHAALPLEDRIMRLWEVLAAVHARGAAEHAEPDGWVSRWMTWLELDQRDRRLIRAVRLSGRQGQDALRAILTSSVWPTRKIDAAGGEDTLAAPAERQTCARAPNDELSGSLFVSRDDPTKALFFVPSEGAVYVAERAGPGRGGCRIGQPVMRVAGDADVRADPDLRLLVEKARNPHHAERGPAGATSVPGSSPRFAYTFYRLRWMCGGGGNPGHCAWSLDASRAGTFDSLLADTKTWGVAGTAAGGISLIESAGGQRAGMEYEAPFDPVRPIDDAQATKYLRAEPPRGAGAGRSSCVALLESWTRPDSADNGAPEAIVTVGNGPGGSRYCAEIMPLSPRDQLLSVYMMPASWDKEIADDSANGKGRGDVASTPKQHVVRYPVSSFVFQSQPVRRSAFGAGPLDGHLVVETTGGQHLSVQWDLKQLQDKGCEVLRRPVLQEHLKLVRYVADDGQLRQPVRPVHPVFGFLMGSEDSVLSGSIGQPCAKPAETASAASDRKVTR